MGGQKEWMDGWMCGMNRWVEGMDWQNEQVGRMNGWVE